MREEREMMWFVGVRKELNFSNEVTEIPSARILLPRSMKCPKEKCSKVKKKKKKNQLGQSSCWNSREGRKEKKGYGNQVVENGMKKKEKKNYDWKILNDVSTKEQAQCVAGGLALRPMKTYIESKVSGTQALIASLVSNFFEFLGSILRTELSECTHWPIFLISKILMLVKKKKILATKLPKL